MQLLRHISLLGCLLPWFAAAPAVAQTGWSQWISGTGANQHWYLAVYVPGGINWANARAAAQALGGDLATITSAEENALVYSMIDEASFWRQLSNPFRVLGPWIGGFQPVGSPEPAGGFQWVSGEPWAFSNWSPGEPNQVHGYQEDHVHFYAGGTVRHPTWNDLRQNQLVPGFVVESTSPPAAAYLSLGTGCAPGTQPPPSLLPAIPGLDLPRLGSTFSLRAGNLPQATQLVAMALGFTNRYANTGLGTVALPMDLATFGWTGCQLLVAPQAVVSQVPVGLLADFPINVPADGALLGVAVFSQALAVSGAGIAMTPSIAAYIGS